MVYRYKDIRLFAGQQAALCPSLQGFHLRRPSFTHQLLANARALRSSSQTFTRQVWQTLPCKTISMSQSKSHTISSLQAASTSEPHPHFPNASSRNKKEKIQELRAIFTTDWPNQSQSKNGSEEIQLFHVME